MLAHHVLDPLRHLVADLIGERLAVDAGAWLDQDHDAVFAGVLATDADPPSIDVQPAQHDPRRPERRVVR